MVSTISAQSGQTNGTNYDPDNSLTLPGGSDQDGRPPRSRTQSRRASNQSKELSELDLPEPSGLGSAYNPRPRIISGNSRSAAVASPGLLSATDLDTSPFVKSVPGSPYIGASSSPQPGSIPRFGDTSASDELVGKLEQLELPEPEALTEGNPRGDSERMRAADEIRDAFSGLAMPEPEYVVRANMRASGAKTPEPPAREPGEVLPAAEFVRRASIKR